MKGGREGGREGGRASGEEGRRVGECPEPIRAEVTELSSDEADAA